MNITYTSKWGLRDGLSIALAYLPVSFAFGLFAVSQGLSPWQALLISLVNVTSAGQLASVPIFLGTMSFFEMGFTQLIINARYALTSITLSQKLDDTVRFGDRFAIAFMNTDEVFAICAEKQGFLGRKYLYPLIIPPYFGWALGTFAGAYLGMLLPVAIVTILGFIIYGMFFSILLPAAKRNRNVLFAELAAALISSILYFVPWFSFISSGFAVIISAIIASALLAILAPCKTSDSNCDREGGDTNE